MAPPDRGAEPPSCSHRGGGLSALTQVGTDVRILLYVQPGASATSVAGWHDGRLRVRLAARPIEGAANEALVRYVAEGCGVPRTRVAVTAGFRSRRKTVVVSDVSLEAVRKRLGLEPPLSPRG